MHYIYHYFAKMPAVYIYLKDRQTYPIFTFSQLLTHYAKTFTFSKSNTYYSVCFVTTAVLCWHLGCFTSAE